MRPETLFLLLILLACPVGMMFMMRGGGHGNHGAPGMHGRHAEDSDGNDKQNVSDTASIEELRSQREALDTEIATREAAKETRPKLPAGA